MTTPREIVIVGGGLAAAKAAEILRKEGFDGRVTIVGDESHRPYNRPPLSKGILLGTAERDSAFLHPEAWYAERDITLRLGTAATAIDRGVREVLLADGSRLSYDALLLATGSRPRRLDAPGADLAGVHYLRTVDDADDLSAAFSGARRVAIIGGGWIGLEVASAARARDLDVTVLETAPLPLLRVLGPVIARDFADLHREHGVDLLCGVRPARLLGEGGAVTGVALDDGARVSADVVVVGVGITPNAELAADAGLAVENGVLVDEHLRTTDPAILAAGDVANAFHPLLGRRVRVEHWANALRQGPVAARSLLGRDVTYDRLPFFYTDQYDLGMEYTGFADPAADDLVLRGDLAGRRYIAFWLAGRRVRAGMNVNVWDVSKAIEALVRSGREVDLGRLRDVDVPLDEV